MVRLLSRMPSLNLRCSVQELGLPLGGSLAPVQPPAYTGRRVQPPQEAATDEPVPFVTDEDEHLAVGKPSIPSCAVARGAKQAEAAAVVSGDEVIECQTL